MNGYRFARFYRERRQQGIPPEWMLRHFPLSLQWIRGVDVCADELGVPSWVFVKLFQNIRDESSRASIAIQNRYGIEVPSVRTTAHAGEDFLHLLTGLRAIDEVMECFDMQEGDRIGHALALRIDAEKWCRQAGPTTLPLHDRLFDLVWEWSVRDRVRGKGTSDRYEFIEYQIQQRAHELYESMDVVPQIYDLAQLQKDLQDPAMLRAVGFPDRDPREVRYRLFEEDASLTEPGRKSERSHSVDVYDGTDRSHHEFMEQRGSGLVKRQRLWWLHQYLTSAELFHRGQQTVTVDPQMMGSALTTIQHALRRKLASRGIVVEINPTSNLMVGDLGDLRNAPFWKLVEPDDSSDSRPVSVCLGSDDPLIFATDLRQEYQRLVDALSMAGYSDDESRAMLNHIRETGLAARFTLPTIVDQPLGFCRAPV